MCERTVTEQLRDAMKASGQLPETIAARTGVSKGVISRFLNRERDIRGKTLDKLCKHLALDLVPRKKKER